MTDQMQTSNTRGCFSCCIGRRVVGVLFDALPLGRRDLAAGNKTLVFEDGYGLTIATRGSYWTESKSDIAQAIDRKKAELDQTSAELKDVLELAGRYPRGKVARCKHVG